LIDDDDDVVVAVEAEKRIIPISLITTSAAVCLTAAGVLQQFS
jgi:hypothetical protein